MAAGGPAGLRLEAVAKAAGVSHPTILHHFGSREGLIQALNLRDRRASQDGPVGVLRHQPGSSENAIAPIFAAYRDGLAQRMVWLMQSGSLMGAAGLARVGRNGAGLACLSRKSWAGPARAFDIADTRAIVHLTTFAAFGDAMLGTRLQAARKSRKKKSRCAQWFEHWFGELLNVYISPDS